MHFFASGQGGAMGVDFRFPNQPDWAWLKRTYPDDVLLHVDYDIANVARACGSRMTYMATPYSLNVLGEDGRYSPQRSRYIEIKTARWARQFAIAGMTVCSPTLLSCAIIDVDCEKRIDPLDQAFWARWRQPMMNACGAIVIPPRSWWDRSLGVWKDACWALQHNMPVYLIRGGSELEVSWAR